VDGENGVFGAMADDRFDPLRQVLVDRREPGVAQLTAMTGGGGSARVSHESNAEVRVRATLRGPGLVMLDDQLTRGWTVRVDRRPARALQVDGVMRGVAVPAGTHSIVWSYSVPGLRAGVILSGIGLAGTLVWIAVGFGYRRRRRFGPTSGPS
jgi:uncharacterized membrane protein YfhO